MEVDESFSELLSLAGLPGSIGASGSRFRNTRILNAKPIGVEVEGQPVELSAATAAALGSSAALARSATGAGHDVLSSAAIVAGRPLSSSALTSSGGLQSSRSLSSRSLSSRSLSSGAIAGGVASDELNYPIDGVFHAPPTGLPKAAEGIVSTPAMTVPTGETTVASQPASAPQSAPQVPTAARDPLAFVGAPKSAALRKPKPRRV